ncbi:hypothetical protein H6S82_00460 [Planktothrix sp. FACHB-1355]|uniref:hypothetical protein n=1 Tax=Planktothrix sp. FACHB-1355 TaxID=2692854 RepID=UPI00168AA707|nr:hypothetical protein [Planktothrix sp. FACHB-1355]MBD3557341.1 hypothetical protein [Planktothrix sp. FACHB-1355]
MKNKEQSLVIDSTMNNPEITQANTISCPRCQLSHIKRNGHITANASKVWSQSPFSGEHGCRLFPLATGCRIRCGDLCATLGKNPQRQ